MNATFNGDSSGWSKFPSLAAKSKIAATSVSLNWNGTGVSSFSSSR